MTNPQTHPPVARGERILIAEDDDVVREVVREVLALGGYDVITAADGPQALGLAEQYALTADLALIDVVMPGMGGAEVARRVVEQNPEIRILFMSGYSDEDLLDHGVDFTRVPFIRKPFTPDSLLSKIREVLGR